MSDLEPRINASPKRIFIAASVALLVAALLLFTVILPVEFDRDPLGTGRLLGLDALANAGDNPLQDAQSEPHRQDYVEFYLEPFKSVEYKYHMEQDAIMVFSWVAEGGDVYYDMHAEPAGLGPDFAESYGAGTVAGESGTYRARFPGIHGWFWENRGRQPVELKLNVSGFVTGATVFGDGGDLEREIDPVFP